MSNYISTPVLKTALDRSIVEYGDETCTILYERDGIFIKAVATLENPDHVKEATVKVFNVPAKLNKAQNNIIKEKLLLEVEKSNDSQEMPLFACMHCGEYCEKFYCNDDCKIAAKND